MNKRTTQAQSAQATWLIPTDHGSLPEAERPQARVLRDGPAACSVFELLQVVIGGPAPAAERTARALLDHCHDLRGIARCSPAELAGVAHGLGQAKAAQLKAGLELGRRLLTAGDAARPQIKTPADAAQLLLPEMALLDQEEVRTLQLDTRNRVLSTALVYRGSLNAASLRVAEVFKEAVRCNAASIVVAHNHPSGDPTPSAEDVQVTKALAQAGKLLDCEVLDHLVIAGGRFVSLKERGLGFDV